MHVLGIDAGATKTVALLADETGAVVGEGRGPGANLHASGAVEVENVLRHVIHGAIGDRAVRPASICVGMAGVDRNDEARAVLDILDRLGFSLRLVVNDALIALAAGVGDRPGIVIIAGTGSIAYGRNAQNEAVRSGGWGHILGDEGSGYWIGREALAAVTRAADGRGPATRLTDDVLAHFEIPDVSHLLAIVYDRDLPRVSVAALGPLVQHAFDLGDPVAARILDRAADELTRLARSVVTRLDMRTRTFTFVLAGGVFRVVPSLADELGRRLVEVAPAAAPRTLESEPAAGAVYLALQAVNGEVRIPQYKRGGPTSQS